MSELTTNGEDDDRPSGGRCNCVDLRRMQEHDPYRLAGGCGISIWKPSILRQASLQVSPDMACQEFNSNRIEGCRALDDTGANPGVPPRYARREVSKSNFVMILHPAIEDLRKQSIYLQPSVGSFKREVGSDYLRYRDGGYVLRPATTLRGPMLNRKP